MWKRVTNSFMYIYFSLRLKSVISFVSSPTATWQPVILTTRITYGNNEIPHTLFFICLFKLSSCSWNCHTINSLLQSSSCWWVLSCFTPTSFSTSVLTVFYFYGILFAVIFLFFRKMWQTPLSYINWKIEPQIWYSFERLHFTS